MARALYDIDEYIKDYFDERVELLQKETDLFRKILLQCESPLEQQFLIWLSKWFCASPNLWSEELYLQGSVVDLLPQSFPVAIRQQSKISLSEYQYRADFMITGYKEDYNDSRWETRPLVRCIVEVDGHDFHERTKEQAQRDKRRDRHFQKNGFPVFRFTGSEVFHDAEEATREIHEFFTDQLSAYIDPPPSPR